MKVLVTGATGFIGRHVTAQLLERGHSVIAVTRDEEKVHEFAWSQSVRVFVCDVHRQLADPAAVFEYPDAVAHLAWPGLPNYQSPIHFLETLPADYRFLKSLIESGVGRLLVTGTCLEYGLQNGALPESALTAPVVPYALAKDALRRWLQFLQQQRSFNLQWARLFYTYGPGQHTSSLLAQLDRAIDNGAAVFNMSGGEQLRDYLPVEDVASRLISLLECSTCDGVFNICSGKPISVRRLAEEHLVKRGTAIRLNLGHYHYPEYEPMAFWGDTEKFLSKVGQEHV